MRITNVYNCIPLIWHESETCELQIKYWNIEYWTTNDHNVKLWKK